MKLQTRERPPVRMLAEVDPATGRLLLDALGLPALVAHYTAREASRFMGVKPDTIRDKVRTGEFYGRLYGERAVVYLTPEHIALNITMLTTNTGLSRATGFDPETNRLRVVEENDGEEGSQ